VEGSRPDVYYLLKDFDSYRDAQIELGKAYRDKRNWAKKALKNIANAGKFSSDRTIMEYAKEIWDVHPVEVEDYID
jgi:phosphorylase (fragment)